MSRIIKIEPLTEEIVKEFAEKLNRNFTINNLLKLKINKIGEDTLIKVIYKNEVLLTETKYTIEEFYYTKNFVKTRSKVFTNMIKLFNERSPVEREFYIDCGCFLYDEYKRNYKEYNNTNLIL